MQKQVFRGLSLIALLVMVLAACSPVATPAPTTAAPAAAPATKAPAAAPATTAPTTPAVTEGGAPAAGTNWCSGT